MTPYETTREKLAALVKSFHDTYYPTMEVNYPDRWITDIEKASQPFSHMEFTFNPKHLDLQANRCVRVKGQLVLNHFTRANQGDSVFGEYTDNLHNFLGLKTLDLVTFREVEAYSNKQIDGFSGKMNSINYEVEYYN